jgi:hypothetical protein
MDIIKTDINCSIENKIIQPMIENSCSFKSISHNENENISYNYKCNNIDVFFQSPKIEEKFNLDNVDHSMIIAPFLYGRMGNYLFPLSHMVILQYELSKKMPSNIFKLYTPYHCSHVSDPESGVANKFNYPKNMNFDIFKNIECKHFSFGQYQYLNLCENENYILNSINDSIEHYYNKNINKNIFIVTIKVYYKVTNNSKSLSEYIDTILPQDKEILNLFNDPTSYKIFISADNNFKFGYMDYDFVEIYKETIMKNLFSSYGQFKNQILNKINSLHNFQNSSFINVCAHIRFGDYGLLDNRNFPILYYDYYLQCLEDIEKKTKKNIFALICFHPSDIKIGRFYERKINEKLIEKKLNSKIKIILEYDITGINEYTSNEILHMYFMSYFDYYIMSNSSYSGWSAFFSKNIYIPDIGFESYAPKFSSKKNITYMSINSYLIYNYSFIIFTKFLEELHKNIDDDKYKLKLSYFIDFFTYKLNFDSHRMINKYSFFSYDFIEEMYTKIDTKEQDNLEESSSGLLAEEPGLLSNDSFGSELLNKDTITFNPINISPNKIIEIIKEISFELSNLCKKTSSQFIINEELCDLLLKESDLNKNIIGGKNNIDKNYLKFMKYKNKNNYKK